MVGDKYQEKPLGTIFLYQYNCTMFRHDHYLQQMIKFLSKYIGLNRLMICWSWWCYSTIKCQCSGSNDPTRSLEKEPKVTSGCKKATLVGFVYKLCFQWERKKLYRGCCEWPNELIHELIKRTWEVEESWNNCDRGAAMYRNDQVELEKLITKTKMTNSKYAVPVGGKPTYDWRKTAVWS